MDGFESINEPGKSRQSFSPPSVNEPPQLPEGETPVITGMDPTTCACGDPDFTLDITGTGFSADSTIWFAGHHEPTTFNAPDTLSTGVKPSLWTSPAVVQVVVRNGIQDSEPVDFTFTEAAPETAMSDPDDLEEEIEEAEDEGEFKPMHRGSKKRKK